MEIMNEETKKKIELITKKIPSLTDGQLYWLNKVLKVFDCKSNFEIQQTDLFDMHSLENFGDALRIHHSFSVEPFSKDKFEYVLVQTLNMKETIAKLANKGNRGHDITIKGIQISLKTQADKNIKKDKLWISKFMELGKGDWGDNPDDLIELRNMFIEHMKNYERILSLRALRKAPKWKYELVEIPKKILQSAINGKLEMKLQSRQIPKPGYCYVRNEDGEEMFQLYFDGGSERKLQVKNLLKKYCLVHAIWEFEVPY
jgi:type II restriction enzyme